MLQRELNLTCLIEERQLAAGCEVISAAVDEQDRINMFRRIDFAGERWHRTVTVIGDIVHPELILIDHDASLAEVVGAKIEAGVSNVIIKCDGSRSNRKAFVVALAAGEANVGLAMSVVAAMFICGALDALVVLRAERRLVVGAMFVVEAGDAVVRDWAAMFGFV